MNNEVSRAMVEIFKTNVNNKRQAGKVLKALSTCLPTYLFNFDLDDCDRILRVKSSGPVIETIAIIRIVKDHQFEISVFDD